MDERIIHYFNSELSEEESVRLLKESENNPVLRDDLLAYQNVRAVFVLSPENTDTDTGHKGYESFTKIRNKRTFLFRLKRVTGYAAAIGLLTGFFWWFAGPGQKQTELIAHRQELFVPPGQRARITLPDGSVVWLNAGSTLGYPSFFGSERKVDLNGEAYFEVAPDKEKPFIVSTDSIDIKALGTRFNVCGYSKSGCFSTTLMQGSVRVYKPGEESEGFLLTPCQRLFYINGKFKLGTDKDLDDLLWKEGIYSFKKVRLDFIIKKLQLYYDVEIMVKDSSLLQYEYTGKFRQRDGVMEILHVIRKIHPFEIEKDDTSNQIIIRK